MSGGLASRAPAVALLTSAYLTGTAIAAIIGGHWLGTLLVGGALAAALMIASRLELRALPLLLATVMLAGAGHARFEAAGERPAAALDGLSGVHALEGRVRDDGVRSGMLTRIDIAIEHIDGERVANAGGLRLTLPALGEPLRAGDRVQLRVEIEAPPEVEAFDYADFLRRRDIVAVAAYPTAFAVTERASESGPAAQLRRLRRWATGNIERALPEPEASLAAGMLLGERRDMPAALTEQLRVTGTTHLVVVSGQNIAMLLGAAIALLTAVISRRRAALIALALLPAYILLVGAEPPVVRAAIMAVGIAVASVTGRRTPGWIYLLYAAALMVAAEPRVALDVAFQLSTTATAGVMLLAPPLRDVALGRLAWETGGWRGALVEAAATATGAALAVIPVQVASFESFSLLTVPANVLVAPLYGATIVIALVAAATGWIEAISTLGGAAAVAPALFIAIVERLARLPGGEIAVNALLVAGVAWYALLAAAIWALQRRDRPLFDPAARPPAGGRLVLGAIAGGLWLAVFAPGDGLASVTVLDVGQGLPVLVSDGDRRVLIDVGPPDGAATTALALAIDGRTIDAVIITHADADHAGGLPALTRRFDAGRLLSGDPAVAGEPIDIGDRLLLGDRTSIEVLSPPLVTGGRAHESDNNRSLVLLVRIGERRILLTADIEAPAEAWLERSGLDLRADAVVVPHHGSRSSSTASFIDAVDPALAVISVGARNPHGHPHEEVVERYESRDVTVLRTDARGTVTLRSDGQRLWVTTER